MTYVNRNNRTYPYNTGLQLGSEADIVLTNENSEPVDASEFFQGITYVKETGGGESQNTKADSNRFKVRNGMIRMYTMQSYCRAYSTDNLWFIMKRIVMLLKRRAYISYVPTIFGEDFEGLKDEMTWTAAGHMKFTVKGDGIYDSTSQGQLRIMTHEHHDESHIRLLDNLRLTVGLISLLLDRRKSAEYRRREYGPFSSKEFRKTDSGLTYQTPTNFWLYSPMLAHLMFGAARWAFFLTQNNFEKDIWEGFESGDIKNAIHNSSYDTAMEIWHLMKSRIQETGYNSETNPFARQSCAILEMLFDNGIGQLGNGVYSNWRMNRRLENFRGHFDDLPSWESGAPRKLLKDGHPMFKTIQKYMEALNAQ